jgi:molecular chaperone Hsp33
LTRLLSATAQRQRSDNPKTKTSALMTDRLARAVHHDLNIRLVAILAPELCQIAATRHRATPAAACALGRGLLSAVLLSTLNPTGERVTIQLLADGPLKGVIADAYEDGLVRGYPLDPEACAGVPMDRRQILAKLIGRDGLCNVVRDIGVRERVQGQVDLVTSEIDEDVEAYLRQSEQVPSALGCELVMDGKGGILAAGAVLLQLMPDSPPEAQTRLREAQMALRGGELFDALKAGVREPMELVRLVLGPQGAGVQLIDEKPVSFRCRCDRGRIEALVRALDPAEIDAMIEEGKAEITCNFCNEVYTIDREALVRLRGERGSQPPN